MTRFFVTLKTKSLQTLQSFSHTEKSILSILLVVFIATTIGMLIKANTIFLVTVPAQGGSLAEGVIGAPRYINPLLATSDTDRDLTSLVYSGLMRPTPKGELVPDLAQNFSISKDGLVYTFTLKDDLVWHDNKPITSDDVIFTIEKVQDSILKSIKRASWEGVAVEKIDDTTITFTLKQQYSPFLENTSLGILPKHIWKNITSEEFGLSKYNIEPIGSGPYTVKNIKRDTSGIPRYYDLMSFKHFSLGQPNITKLRINFYPNEEQLLRAFSKNSVSAVNAISSETVSQIEENDKNITTYVLPRMFGVFLNQNQNTVFTNFSVRQALEVAIDREAIIEEVLFGYGTELYGPLPPGSLGFIKTKEGNDKENTDTQDSEVVKKDIENIDREGSPSPVLLPDSEEEEIIRINPRIETAIAILEKNGWKINEETDIRERKTSKGTEELSFSLATADPYELKRTATIIKETWGKLGAKVDLKIFNSSDLNHNVIRPRRYDALFFGEIIGRESDPFPFWHSSQRNDPGLNIALYTNITTDKLLEDGRVTFDKEDRIKIYQQFQEEVMQDVPAIFVYSPDFIYIVPENIQGIDAGTITVPSERFLDIHTWYIETEKLWRIFAKDISPIKS